jgi:hypothetical protein
MTIPSSPGTIPAGGTERLPPHRGGGRVPLHPALGVPVVRIGLRRLVPRGEDRTAQPVAEVGGPNWLNMDHGTLCCGKCTILCCPNTEECMYSDEVVENAWMRARARCEGERASQGGPAARCNTPLLWTARGPERREGAWEANRTGEPTRGGWHAVKDCEVLCWDCFRQARGGGRVPQRTAAARP